MPERAQRATDGARIRGRRAIHRRGYVPGLLSIVVPCYRVEDFLDECLVSLRFQLYREVEIIVVDDGSPDRSGEIARHHARRDLRVRVVTRENGGLSAARNTGIEHARGEFLTFVDSDDVVTPEAYSTAIEAISESGSDFVLSCYDRLEGKKRVPAGAWIRAAHARRRLGVDLDTFPDAMVNAVAWSKTYRRDVLGPGPAALPRGQALRGPAGQRGGVRTGARLRRAPRHLGVVADPQRPLLDLPERVVDPQPRRLTTRPWPRRSRRCVRRARTAPSRSVRSS